MNLVTIEAVRPATAITDGQLAWQPTDSWLAGGTWLFSEPQLHLRRLLDLHAFGWPPLTVTPDGLRIAATCTIAQLDAFVAPPGWTAAPLFDQCARSLLASFKVWQAATVGGNICMSLPAGAMISLTASLEGVCHLRLPEGAERQVPVAEFVTGNNQNVLLPGELLVAVELPVSALRKRSAFRRLSLTHQGRSTVLLVGTRGEDGAFRLTITAATPHPVVLNFDAVPDAATLHARIDAAVLSVGWFADVHGTPEYRAYITHHLADEIRAELAA